MKKLLLLCALVCVLASACLAQTQHGRIKLGPQAFADLGAPDDGTEVYCSDCQQVNPCADGGSGAKAMRIAGAWSCSSGSGAADWDTLTNRPALAGDGSIAQVGDLDVSIAACPTDGSDAKACISNNSASHLQKWVVGSGNESSIGTSPGVAFTAGNVIRLSAIGTSIVCRDVTAGTDLITATDSSVTSGKTGISGFASGSVTTGPAVDSFVGKH